jgi:hypothetical protein
MNCITSGVHAVGNFDVETGWVHVTDPTSSFAHCSQLTLKGLKPGAWHARINLFLDETGIFVHVRQLSAFHESIDRQEDLLWCYAGVIQVDSGQVGIIDVEQYAPDNDDWCAQVYRITNSGKFHAGIIEGGVVSESGLGVGIYSTYIAFDRQMNITAIRVNL